MKRISSRIVTIIIVNLVFCCLPTSAGYSNSFYVDGYDSDLGWNFPGTYDIEIKTNQGDVVHWEVNCEYPDKLDVQVIDPYGIVIDSVNSQTKAGGKFHAEAGTYHIHLENHIYLGVSGTYTINIEGHWHYIGSIILILSVVIAIIMAIVLPIGILIRKRGMKIKTMAPPQIPQSHSQGQLNAQYCGNCGHSIPSGNQFCGVCGKHL